MDILHEASDAIGNVGRKVLRRKRRAQAEEALERWSARIPVPQVSARKKSVVLEEDVIDGTYRTLDENHDESEGESR